MRGALISLIGRKFNNNYGAVLQAFALQKFLKELGIESEYLDYDPTAKFNLQIWVKRFIYTQEPTGE